ncbi:hypothetical protein HQ34_07060 [Porphyromonas cangingivalis]|nr:hypothetical protein HQ34_07060 [Porphyromonas cangingivalis]
MLSLTISADYLHDYRYLNDCDNDKSPRSPKPKSKRKDTETDSEIDTKDTKAFILCSIITSDKTQPFRLK